MADDLHTYRQMLRVNRHRLDDELEIQAEVQDRIGQRLTVMSSRMIEAEDTLKKVEAQLFRKFKDEGEKVTDAAAKSEALRHKDRDSAWKDWQRARAEHQEWAQLYDAWKGRGFSMKDLGGLYVAQYFAIDSIGRKEPVGYRVSRHSPTPEPPADPVVDRGSLRRRLGGS